MIGIAEAAKLAGVSKPTLHRAIRSGKLTAKRSERHAQALEIDPAELARVFPIRNAPERSAPVDSVESGPVIRTEPVESVELAVTRARLEEATKRIADLAADRDAWRAQAERLALAPPAVVRPWWKRLIG